MTHMTYDEAKYVVAFLARNVDTYSQWLHRYDYAALERAIAQNPAREAVEKEIVRLWAAAKASAA